jgi:hypothetical protein
MTTDQIIAGFIEHRVRPHVEMCAAADCYATRPATGQPPVNDWSLVSVGADRFVFCPEHGLRMGIGKFHKPSELRRMKACVNRCQQLISARDN